MKNFIKMILVLSLTLSGCYQSHIQDPICDADPEHDYMINFRDSFMHAPICGDFAHVSFADIELIRGGDITVFGADTISVYTWNGMDAEGTHYVKYDESGNVVATILLFNGFHFIITDLFSGCSQDINWSLLTSCL